MILTSDEHDTCIFSSEVETREETSNIAVKIAIEKYYLIIYKTGNIVHR